MNPGSLSATSQPAAAAAERLSCYGRLSPDSHDNGAAECQNGRNIMPVHDKNRLAHLLFNMGANRKNSYNL